MRPPQFRAACSGHTKKGANCKNKEYEAGVGYCRIHFKIHGPQGEQKEDGVPAAPRKRKFTPSKKCSGRYWHNDRLEKCTMTKKNDGSGTRYCDTCHDSYCREAEPCSICFDDIDSKKEVPLSCGHWFHRECLQKWNKPSCPLCRAEMSIRDCAAYIKENTAIRDFVLSAGVALNELASQLISVRDPSAVLASNMVNLLFGSHFAPFTISIHEYLRITLDIARSEDFDTAMSMALD